MNKDITSFWKSINNMRNNNTPLPNCIDGHTGEKEISSMWQSHYKSLLNSFNDDMYKNEVGEYVKEVPNCKGMSVSVSEVSTIVEA